MRAIVFWTVAAFIPIFIFACILPSAEAGVLRNILLRSNILDDEDMTSGESRNKVSILFSLFLENGRNKIVSDGTFYLFPLFHGRIGKIWQRFLFLTFCKALFLPLCFMVVIYDITLS